MAWSAGDADNVNARLAKLRQTERSWPGSFAIARRTDAQRFHARRAVGRDRRSSACWWRSCCRRFRPAARRRGEAQCASQMRQLASRRRSHVAAKGAFPSGIRAVVLQLGRLATAAFRCSPTCCRTWKRANALVSWDYDDPINNANQGAESNTAVVLPLLVCPSDPIDQNPIVMTSRNWDLRPDQLRRQRRHSLVLSATVDGRRHVSHHRRGIRAEERTSGRFVRGKSPTG